MQQRAGLTVYRASAGSGKTYTLTMEYIRKVLGEEYNINRFREILAVTFTNKATEEMKSRIVDTLNNIVSNPDFDVEMLCNELNINKNTLQNRAAKVQKAILHNYSSFSISTIDRFFQKIIHAFVREAGLHPGFRIELDHDRLLDEAVDRLIRSLQPHSPLYDYLLSIIDEQMERGRNWDVRHVIKKKGSAVFKEKFGAFDSDFHAKIRDNEFMTRFANEMDAIINSFDTQMAEAGACAIELIANNGLTMENFAYKKNGAANYFHKIIGAKYEIGNYEPGKRVLDLLEADDPMKWFPKQTGNAQQTNLFELGAALSQLLSRCLALYNDKFAHYCTALCIKDALKSLRFLAVIETALLDVAKTENLMTLGKTTGLLGKLINENDAPFIYERIGGRYSIFMIDEFQDTSEAQWRNFRPLLSNSLAENHPSLVVGDVKQSIYRWRSGDWRILASQIFKDFNHFDIHEKNLDTNWRSCANIIEFNNAIFSQLPHYIEQKYATATFSPQSDVAISAAYTGVDQRVAPKNKNRTGYVSLSVISRSERGEARNSVLENLPKLLADLQDRGFAAGEIAIVVRTAADGMAVAGKMLEHKRNSGDTVHCFDVVSSDSLNIISSPSVRFLIAILRATISPKDEINNAVINRFRHLHGANCLWNKSKYLDNETETFINKLVSLSLLEIIEQAINFFELGNIPAEIPYIQELHSAVLKFANSEISDVSAFLDHWDENGEKIRLSGGQMPDSINIVTIHSSKGLEYPVVIIPFCNWNILPHTGETVWVEPSVAPFNQIAQIPIPFGEMMRNSLFVSNYNMETMQTLIDNLNLLYVAFTRAEEELHIMLPLSETTSSASKGSDTKLGNAAKTITDFLHDNQDFMKGKIQRETLDDDEIYSVGEKTQYRNARTKTSNGLILSQYPSLPFAKKLKLKYNSENYFPDAQNAIQSRNYGNLMHRIFSMIASVDDLPAALSDIEAEGLIDKSRLPELKAKVEKALDYAGEWFTLNSGYRIITERFLILPAALNLGVSRKPDRIMCSASETIVIDYKFGVHKRKSYIEQIQNYIRILEAMNYPNVKGYLWYVDLFEKEMITL
ncbi:MAG: UvrD-helicase domain-containing protein [Prevotellaceae bacterium]|nr:UvrD-helicase domain-containing protein [Prevotellaceae bacterium]